VSYKQQSKTTG